MRGAVASVVATYPVAALCALFFRFPVPFAGYVSGVKGAAVSAVAVTFYGVLFGGFLVQGGLGAIAGVITASRPAGDRGQLARRFIIAGTVASIPGVALLAVFDKIVGSW